MSRVLLGQSYYLHFDPKLQRAMQPYPPLGTLYAASELRRHGHEVAVFDAMLEPDEAGWGGALERYQPEVAVLFEDNFNYLSKMCLLRMRDAGFRMLDMARRHGATTIVCGSDATDNAERYLDHGADVVILGEGEVTLAELLGRLDARGGARPPVPLAPLDPFHPLEATVGIAVRGEGGTVVSTGRRENLRDLDALPFPARDLIDVERYRAAWTRHGRFSMNVSTTRGCPFHCNWCAKPIWGQRYAVRSPENVVAELVELRDRYHPDHISFVDDIFGLRPGWLRTFAELVRVHDVRRPFKCLSRADLLLRDGEIEALRDAGCEMVWIGAESGSQSVLDAMDKGTRVEQIVEAAQRLRTAGIRVGFFLQFGYPGERREDIEATRRLVRECLPDDIGISVSYPLPGTPFYERVRADLGSKRNWDRSDDLAMLYRGPYSTRFYRRLHGVVHKEFRLRRPVSRPRERLGRLRDLATLPIDRLVLAGMQRLERGLADRDRVEAGA
ncbi:MAG: B12-binding domain-containing radical SAM protein [Chloroflexi bacterium]|nr:B12-binding domain-containing radical SAM protein [Chloroflexota bacterium]